MKKENFWTETALYKLRVRMHLQFFPFQFKNKNTKLIQHAS